VTGARETILARCGEVCLLIGVQLALRHSRAKDKVGTRADVSPCVWRSRRPAPRWFAAVIATAGPAVLFTRAALRTPMSWRAPQTAGARLGLMAVVVAGAATEEGLWRGPLTYPMRVSRRLAVGACGAAGFVAVHLPRDGRAGAPVHTVNALSWTLAAMVDRSIAWPLIAHTGYNMALHCAAPGVSV
jgi:hypothetical protein